MVWGQSEPVNSTLKLLHRSFYCLVFLGKSLAQIDGIVRHSRTGNRGKDGFLEVFDCF